MVVGMPPRERSSLPCSPRTQHACLGPAEAGPRESASGFGISGTDRACLAGSFDRSLTQVGVGGEL